MVGYAADARGRTPLEAGTGVETWSRERIFGEFARLRTALPVPTVLVVAGAERLAAAELAELADACERTRSKLVLVGEPGRLLPEDRAGGWRAAERAVPSLHLERVNPGRDRPHPDRRLIPDRADPTWADPTRAVPDPPPAGPFRSDRLVMAPRPEELRDVLVDDWRRHPPGRAVMVASTRADVEDLNSRARTLLRSEGRLVGPEMVVGGVVLQSGDRAVVAAVDGTARSLGMAVGQFLEADAGLLRLAGGTAVSPTGLPSGMALRHAYALTPYQASRSGFPERLVLGGPSPRTPDSGSRSTFYLVGSGKDALRRLVELDPSPYLVATLGTPPMGAGRREWREAAVEVERYRARWGISDPRRALGGPAGEGLQGAQRREVQRLVETVRGRAERIRQVEPPSLERGLHRSGS